MLLFKLLLIAAQWVAIQVLQMSGTSDDVIAFVIQHVRMYRDVLLPH